MEEKVVYPYWGCKQKCTDIIWDRLGKVDVFIDPFMGSNIVALRNPYYTHLKQEIINDHNGYLINFWRSIKFDPARTAFYADFPSSHIQLTANHKILHSRFNDLPELLKADPFYYDPVCAGLWAYTMCESIDLGRDLHIGKPNYSSIPNVGSIKGLAMRRTLTPHNKDIENEWKLTGQRMYEWFRLISDRFKVASVLCKDWKELYSATLTGQKVSNPTPNRITGIFFDPPYGTKNLESNKYLDDSSDIASEVQEVAIELGENPRNRVCIAGYEKDYEMPDNWEKVIWKYSQNRFSYREVNYSRTECLWFSPYCIRPRQDLFSLNGHYPEREIDYAKSTGTSYVDKRG